MGFISSIVNTSGTKAHGLARGAVEQGRAAWRQVFEGVSKEDGLRQFPRVRDRQSWTRGAISEPAAFKRLLQAMRSMAPGGWSDDRWEQSRHENGIVFTSIFRKSEIMGMSTFQVSKRDLKNPDGKRPITPDDPAEGDRPVKPYDLVRLLEDPNNQDGWGDMVFRWQQQLDLTGSALTWMVPNQLGVPYELYVVPTAIAIPQPAINPDYPDGYYRVQPIYPYGPFSSYPTPATAVGAPIPAQWMLRFQYPHPLLRYDGLSPLTALKLHIDEVEAIDRSRWYTMQRIINPSAVLNFKDMEGMEPLPEAEIERIKAEFEADFQGPTNSGRLFVAAPGSELNIQESRLRDLECRDGWSQLVEFIHGAGFGISKTAAGMVESSTYSVLFATLKQLHMITLDPQCKRFGRQLTKHLAPFFGDDLIIEVRTPRIDDHDIKNAIIQLLLNGKALTKNEMRQALEYPLTDEQWGDEIGGTESQQGQMPGMPGAPGMGAPGAPGMEGMPGMEAPGAPGGPQALEASGMPPPVDRVFPQAPSVGPSERAGVMPEPPVIAKGRPRPGKLSRGGQGPRKSLDAFDIDKADLPERLRTRVAGVYRKSLEAELDQVLANGHTH